jgi:hypothetical protein
MHPPQLQLKPLTLLATPPFLAQTIIPLSLLALLVLELHRPDQHAGEDCEGGAAANVDGVAGYESADEKDSVFWRFKREIKGGPAYLGPLVGM